MRSKDSLDLVNNGWDYNQISLSWGQIQVVLYWKKKNNSPPIWSDKYIKKWSACEGKEGQKNLLEIEETADEDPWTRREPVLDKNKLQEMTCYQL